MMLKVVVQSFLPDYSISRNGHTGLENDYGLLKQPQTMSV